MNRPLLDDLNPGLKVLMLFSFYLISAILFGLLAVKLVALIWGFDMMDVDATAIPAEDYQRYRHGLFFSNFITQLGIHLIAALTFFQFTQPEGIDFARFSVKPSRSFLGWMVILGVSGLFGGILIGEINGNIIEALNLRGVVDAASENAVTTQHILLGGGNTDIFLSVILFGIVAPFCEEVFFRGGLQQLLLRTMKNKGMAILLAGLIFAIIHVEFNGFLVRVMMGCLLGWVFFKTGSIWPGVVLHVVYNTVGVILQHESLTWNISGQQITILSIVGLGITLGVVLLLRKQYIAPEWPIEVPKGPSNNIEDDLHDDHFLE